MQGKEEIKPRSKILFWNEGRNMAVIDCLSCHRQHLWLNGLKWSDEEHEPASSWVTHLCKSDGDERSGIWKVSQKFLSVDTSLARIGEYSAISPEIIETFPCNHFLSLRNNDLMCDFIHFLILLGLPFGAVLVGSSFPCLVLVSQLHSQPRCSSQLCSGPLASQRDLQPWAPGPAHSPPGTILWTVRDFLLSVCSSDWKHGFLESIVSELQLSC